jgi:hypothetical protein
MKKTYSFGRLHGHACNPAVVAGIQKLYGDCAITPSATLKMCNHDMVFAAMNIQKKKEPVVGLLTLSAAHTPIGNIVIVQLPLVAKSDGCIDLFKPLFVTAINFAKSKRFVQMQTAFPLSALDLRHLEVLKRLGFSTNSFQAHQLAL